MPELQKNCFISKFDNRQYVKRLSTDKINVRCKMQIHHSGGSPFVKLPRSSASALARQAIITRVYLSIVSAPSHDRRAAMWRPVPNPSEPPKCGICDKPANQQCGGCHLVYYCSRAHQKLGWREGHKLQCCAFKVQFSDTMGRHMVATRDIKPGEMILKEKPALSGPRMSTSPMCLGCNRKLQPLKNDDGKWDYYKCSSCRWPMCGPKCEQLEIHKQECDLMTSRKYKCTISFDGHEKTEPAYCVIAPLRALLMKENNPKQYENIINLESHLSERLGTPLYTVLKANLVTFIVQVLGLHFDEEHILKIASILDTNTFDVRSPDGTKRFRAIYVTAAMMNHNCKPNTKHVFMGDESHIAVIATVPIAKGELITATYTQTLMGTLDRRRHLNLSKCFNCDCERCKDGTEFGTYIGSIYCSVCNGPGSDHALTRGAMMVSIDPLDEASPWKCEKCEHTVQSKQMFWGNNALKQDLAQLDKTNPRSFEDFIEKYKQTLHPNNCHSIQAKFALFQIYGNQKCYTLPELSDRLLERKIELCHELLELSEQLEPGLSRFRGRLLLDLQAAVTVQTKREFETDRITKAGAQDQLMESMALLQEATNICRVEPDLRDTLETRIQELARLLEDSAHNAEDEFSNNEAVPT